MPRIKQQVGGFEQRADLRHAGRPVEIGRQAALVGVEPGEISAFVTPIAGIDQRCDLSRGIAA